MRKKLRDNDQQSISIVVLIMYIVLHRLYRSQKNHKKINKDMARIKDLKTFVQKSIRESIY